MTGEYKDTGVTRVDEKGHKWYDYGLDFTSPEGTYGLSIPAISLEHAWLQFEALKETGRITGRIEGRTK